VRHCVKFIGLVTVMRAMNEFLATGPFDLYELQLFHLVAEHQSFTKAGRAAGLTQSAITRQIRGIEDRLGIRLFERTTRSVRMTPAGAALHARSGAILSEVNSAISALKSSCGLVPKTLRVGIARTIGLAYLPGFFRRFQTRFPRVQLHVTHEASAFIVAAVESGELDAGIVAAPPQLSRGVQVTHRFTDEFVVIVPPGLKLARSTRPVMPSDLSKLLRQQRWLFISEATNTGKRLRAWLERNGLKLEAAMQADNFDFIANLVSLGMGVSIVPHRVLALHPNRRPVQRITTNPKFSRDIIIVVRRQQELTPALAGFVEDILF
jgi:DNA-binding transcriptional LysR family regulator